MSAKDGQAGIKNQISNSNDPSLIQGMCFDSNNDDSLTDPNNDFVSISSASSHSSNSNTVSVFSTYTMQVNSNATPKTLKFILNMVLIILAIMIVTSSIVLFISQQNLQRAQVAFSVSQLSFKTISDMTSTRILLRSLTDIMQGYKSNNSSYIANRTSFYQSQVLGIIDELTLYSD